MKKNHKLCICNTWILIGRSWNCSWLAKRKSVRKEGKKKKKNNTTSTLWLADCIFSLFFFSDPSLFTAAYIKLINMASFFFFVLLLILKRKRNAEESNSRFKTEMRWKESLFLLMSPCQLPPYFMPERNKHLLILWNWEFCLKNQGILFFGFTKQSDKSATKFLHFCFV